MPNRSSWHTPARRPASPWIVLAALVVVAGATFALGAVITDRLTRPLRTVAAGVDPGAFGGVFETVTLRSADDRADLDAWLLPVPGFDAGVVLVHGKDGSKSNTSGDGRYAFGFMERFDVIAGVQQLVQEASVASGSVGLLGVSMGGASVLYAAAIDPRVGAVWSDAAYADLWPIIVQDPVGQAQVLASAAPWAGVWLLDGVGHAGAFDHDRALYTLRAVEFFDEALRVRLAGRPQESERSCRWRDDRSTVDATPGSRDRRSMCRH